MFLSRIGRNRALTLASLLIAVTTVYALGWIRYSGSEPTARLGLYYEYRAQAGELVVTGVEPAGPAAAAGLQPGDRILAIDGAALSTQAPVYDSIFRGQPGDPVVLSVKREHSRACRSRLRLAAGELLRLYPVGFLVVHLDGEVSLLT